MLPTVKMMREGCVEGMKEKHGAEHQDTMIIQQAYAEVLMRQGRDVDAATIMDDVAATAEKARLLVCFAPLIVTLFSHSVCIGQLCAHANCN